ncbi:hypothetical protein PROFUN_03351 [Planoprotostelium fungivorum]|uniref:ATP-dependent (S)-NAD(P)H-hydrate dehydratase n=1 Tax=Planoprotostelium fungivorum TaxID=1890364 RepID=A0A2P6NWA0_9EUKA|nr:hypothetical protein PROFUN_03351 [Planoprotostelium fungivorum]
MSRQHLIESLKRIIPSLDYSKHKGQAGRIGLMGGSREYTGAPYYASYTSLKAGADLSFIFCHESAATAIKSYSPELIVYPTIPNEKGKTTKEIEGQVLDSMSRFFDSLHVLVIGPGLGRDETTSSCVKRVIERAREKSLPLDGLFVVQQELDLIKGYEWAILTPNVNEYKNLCKSANLKEDSTVKELSQKLGNVTIVQKGRHDIVSDGKKEIKNEEEGGPRRCGGQGDIMSGLIGTFLAWCNIHHKSGEKLSEDSPSYTLLSGYFGSLITRETSLAAFRKHLRSTTTPDMISEVGPVMEKFFPCGAKL